MIRFARCAGGALLLLVVFLVMANFWPLGSDYFYTFRPVAEALLRGEMQLYSAVGHGYYNMPWMTLLIVPLAWLPLGCGQAVLTMMTLVGLLFSIYVVARGTGRWYVLLVALAMSSLHVFDLLVRGNVDGFLLFGLALGLLGVERRKPLVLGAGLWFLSLKPPNVVLPALVLLWAIRDWSWREKAICVVPLVLTLLVSFPVFGLDWPIRYLRYVGESPPFVEPQVSLWRAFHFFGLGQGWSWLVSLPVLLAFVVVVPRVFDLRRTLALAVAVNLVVSPYVLGSHYVLLAPVFVLLACEYKPAVVLWLFTLTPLLRLVWGWDVTWMDIVYPVSVAAGMFSLVWERAPVLSWIVKARANAVSGG